MRKALLALVAVVGVVAGASVHAFASPGSKPVSPMKCDDGSEITCPSCPEGQGCTCDCRVGKCWCA